MPIAECSVLPTATEFPSAMWRSACSCLGRSCSPSQLGEFRLLGLNAPITGVNLLARAGDWWQKGPDPALITDADGQVASEADLTDPNYKTAGNVHSANFTGGAFRKGELVALWDDASQTAAEVEVGLTHQTQNVPNRPRPTKLHLAFHDGVEWSNNTGSVVVRVSWLT